MQVLMHFVIMLTASVVDCSNTSRGQQRFLVNGNHTRKEGMTQIQETGPRDVNIILC